MLGEVLDEISDYYAKRPRRHQSGYRNDRALMIVAMGSIVGFIAMAIILPIFKMSQIVQ